MIILTGYNAPRATIDHIAETLAPGNIRVRTALAEQFDRILIESLPKDPDDRWRRKHWTEATDQDLENAAAHLDRVCSDPVQNPVDGEVPIFGGVLRVRGHDAFLEAGDYSVRVAMARGSERYDYRQSQNVEGWMISLTKFGEEIRLRTDGPSTTNATSSTGAHKSLRNLVEKFFKVSLANVGA